MKGQANVDIGSDGFVKSIIESARTIGIYT